MSDKVVLEVDGKRIEEFISYNIESNLFTADDAFELSLVNPEIDIPEGAQCKLYVNGIIELNGIIDVIEEGYDKNGRTLSLKGRDLMGLLVDSYCEEFGTFENISLKALAEKLIKNVPFINRKAIIYSKGNKNRAVPLSHKVEDYKFTQIEPGQTIFEKLKDYAMERGLLFFNMPKGTFVFGEPLTKPTEDGIVFTLVNKKDGSGNIKSAKRTRNISKRYSKVKIIHEKQGDDDTAAVNIQDSKEVIDKSAPFYKDGKSVFYKPFVGTAEHDGQNLQKYAQIIMDQQKFEGDSLEYVTSGYSQGKNNFQVNAICHVIDESYNIKEDMLIYSRTFSMSKDEGTTTTLRLSKLGVLPA